MYQLARLVCVLVVAVWALVAVLEQHVRKAHEREESSHNLDAFKLMHESILNGSTTTQAATRVSFNTKHDGNFASRVLSTITS